jgi:hypothetical protein
VTWEATTKRVTPAFLAANTVTSLLAKAILNWKATAA